MLTQEGTAKLLDFGLAKLADDLTRTTSKFAAITPHGTARAPGAAQAAGRIDTGTVLQLQSIAHAATEAGSQPQPIVRPGAQAALETTQDGDPIEPAGASATDRPLLVTAEGAIIGTPAYMPPEMWRGEPATEQADLYMLGAVLYQLCCGSLPHDQQARSELRHAVLNERAQLLCQRVPGVDRRLALVIAACLERDLDKRLHSAEQLQEQLEAIAAEPDGPPVQPPARWPRVRSWVLSGGLLLAGGLAVLGAQRYASHQSQAASLAKAAPRPRVAVLGLRLPSGESPQLARLGRAFAELLGAELAAGERLLVLPAERVEHMKLELGLDEAEAYPLPTLGRIHRNLGPDLVVVGTLAPQEPRGTLSVTVEVKDCLTGAVTATAKVTGPAAELFTLASQVGGELRRRLGSSALSGNERAELRAQRPASPEVAQLYADGLVRLRRFDPAGARRILERVVEADPDFPLGHLALADALHALGYDERQRVEVQRAFALSGNLRREERSLIEARYRETTKEWPAAFALYRTLATIHPDQLDHSLDLAAAQLRAERPAESLHTVQELRQLPEPLRSDPRIDLAEARAQMERSNFTAALTLLDRAAQKQEAVGAPLLLASTLLLSAFARIDLGQHERAQKDAERAQALFTAGGDSFGAVDSLWAVGTIHSWRGDLAQALAVGEQTLKLLMDAENDTLTAVHLGNLASRLCQRGQLPLAKARAEAGLLLGRQVGNREATGQALVSLGLIAFLRAELPEAEERFAQARAELQLLGDPRMTAWVDFHVGQLRVAQGRLEEATELHQRALQVRDAQQLGSFAAESRMALATLALLRGDSAQAESLARAALLRFTEDRSADNLAWAQALLGQALTARGRTTEAREFLVAAAMQLAQSQNVLLRTRALSLLAPAAAAATDELPALRLQLLTALGQAHDAGFLPEELELALQLRLLSGSAAHPRRARHREKVPMPELCDLARQAHGLGLALIAKRAREAATPGCTPAP